jgi:GT2 family glycosyltransferase
MGAITFSLDQRLVKSLKKVLPINTLVETGTFRGDTIAELQAYFSKVISIELSEALWAEAVNRFEKYQHVKILKGSSNDKLQELTPALCNEATLYWLDAHWCVANDTAGECSQCPLIHELQAIGNLNSQSVLLIDDARLFLSPPLAPHEISQWPSFNQIVNQLLSMSQKHELMVVNDVIAFYPIQAKASMEDYAQTFGVDWLFASNCMKEKGTSMQQLVDKESIIVQQKNAIQDKVLLIQDKDLLIHEQARVLRNYNQLFSFLRPILPLLRIVKKTVKTIKRIFRPKLGNLNQYPPRLLIINQIENGSRLTNTPRISIVTPSYQQGEYIERTILSVLNQEYPNLEYFVQDGGSKDNSLSIIKQYGEKLTGWDSKKDNGQSHAINLGFSKTTGEIMAWLNSDDILLPGALATIAEYFNLHPDVDVVYGNRLLIDENDMEIGRWILPGHDDKVLKWADYIPQETLFWRRSIWDKVDSKIDETFKFAMDWDLIIRFQQIGAKFAHIPFFLGAFRIHKQQKTLATINEIGHQEMDRIRERVLGRVPTRKEIRRKVTPFILKHVLVDIFYKIK